MNDQNKNDEVDVSFPLEPTQQNASALGRSRRRPWRRCAAMLGCAAALGAPEAHAQSVGETETFLHQSYLSGVSGQLYLGAALGLGMADSNASGEVWHEANLVEMLIDYQETTGDDAFQRIVEAYDNAHYDPIRPFLAIMNGFNDDDLWWAAADLRAYQLYGDSSWLIPAQRVFQHVCTQWGSVQGANGGVPQALPGHNSNSLYLNAITNELLFLVSIELYDAASQGVISNAGVCPGVTTAYANDYLGWSVAEYEWMKAHFMYPGALPIKDGIQMPNGGAFAQGTAITYNQGPILGALLALSRVAPAQLSSHAEGDSPTTILDYGFDIANVAMGTFVTSSSAVLTEASGVNVNSGNGDGAEFKGIFERYLGRFVTGAAPEWGGYSNACTQFTSDATAFLDRSAASIWANSNNGTAAPPIWTQPAVAPADPWVVEPMVTSAADGLIAAINVDGPPPPAGPAAPSAPGCTLRTACNAEYFPPGLGSPSEQEISTVAWTNCKTLPTEVQELSGGTWVSLAYFKSNAGDVTAPSSVYDVLGSLSGGQSVRACVTTGAGTCESPTVTTCDPPTEITVASCTTGGGGGGGGGNTTCIPASDVCAETCGGTVQACGGLQHCPRYTGAACCAHLNGVYEPNSAPPPYHCAFL